MLKSNDGSLGWSVVKQVMLAGVLAFALSACATWRIKPTLAGPGVPIISNLQVEPVKVRVGEAVRITFDFEDTDADVVETRIFPSEVREWVYRPALAPKVVNLKTDKYGLAIGKVETHLKWESEGIRVLEVFVVDEQNHTSNALRARVAVIR
ncbi:hypothetical protein CLG94_02705 [Candidatus Methylomirabilis limnetica]|jgi:hypothetical protein|uniref:Intracellular proteinase inhibitor BsuPI domain-containing protein n=1 Tax=Candidatus Methylomirabilis limnetica TaxID=2033718 RepID=A0A2T4TZV2_9BACT|nr:hypothetical protein [Candidatus Methylomirabilis limnetica]PTL36611.1 hypothetical protein CLG94_02705 [Candidatus Methylomirabilis limnetica]